jgi:hypothetical protein
MPDRTPAKESSLLIAGLDKLQEVARSRVAELGDVDDATRDVISKSASAATADLDRWDLFLAHIQQLREMLEREPKLVPIVDDFIGQRYRRLERRQWGINALFTLGGAILGWIVSAVGSPQAALNALLHFPH